MVKWGVGDGERGLERVELEGRRVGVFVGGRRGRDEEEGGEGEEIDR